MKKIVFGLLLNNFLNIASAQDSTRIKDTGFVTPKYLPEITLVGRNSGSDIHFLPEVVGTNINAGKKNSL
jgi:Fe(3+) dicitrate transport protein